MQYAFVSQVFRCVPGMGDNKVSKDSYELGNRNYYPKARVFIVEWDLKGLNAQEHTTYGNQISKLLVLPFF